MIKVLKAVKVVFKYIVMFLTMLMPRDYKLCVFGAWLGERFADNSKQLFIEASDRDDIRAVWITKGLPVGNKRSKKSSASCRICSYLKWYK